MTMYNVFYLRRALILLTCFGLSTVAFSQELASSQRYSRTYQSVKTEHQPQKITLKDALEKLQEDLKIQFAYDEDLAEAQVISAQVIMGLKQE